MSLKIAERQLGGVTVLDVSGRIVLGAESAQLREAVREHLAAGKKSIVLNLGGVPYVDSTAIGELISACLAVRREGGDVKLLNVTKKVHDVVQIVRIGSILEIFDDEAAAVNAFAKSDKQEGDLKVRAS